MWTFQEIQEIFTIFLNYFEFLLEVVDNFPVGWVKGRGETTLKEECPIYRKKSKYVFDLFSCSREIEFTLFLWESWV